MSSARTSCSGVMFLRRTNVPCRSSSGDVALRGDEHECALVREQPFHLEPIRDRRRGIAVLDDELDLGRIGGRRLGQRRTEILADDVGDEGEPQGCGVVGGDPEDHRIDDRAKRGERHDEHDGGEHEREQQELDETHDPAAAMAVAAAVAAADRLVGVGVVVGRVRVRFVAMRLGSARVTGASAGADRHGRVSIVVWGRVEDARASRRVSSSSCRMIAAASRSTRAR